MARHRRMEGKIIDRRTMKDGDGNNVEVRIHMVATGSGVTFFATCPAIPLLKTEKVGTVDIVLGLAKEAVAAVKAITWKRQLRVRLTATEPGAREMPLTPGERVSVEYELKLEVDEFETGLSGGKPVYRHREKHRYSWQRGDEYGPIQEGSPAGDRYRSDEIQVSTMVGDAPATRKALYILLELVGKVDANLQNLLGEEKITQTLAALAANKLPDLTAAPPKKKKGRK